MKRVRLPFLPGLEVEFADRGRGVQQVLEWAERGTRFPIVVFGPEGCGKTAWLRQAVELLRERGFEVVYVNPLQKEYLAHVNVREVAKELAEVAARALGGAGAELAYAAFSAARELVRLKRRKVAVLVDDAFQAIGPGEAAAYVKSLLGLIEYPPESYERIVAVAATSEGLSRREIGRHRWATLMPMWNMSREGFEELFKQLPGPKPSFEEAWRLTGGNPWMLAQLHQARWDASEVVRRTASSRELTASFVRKWRRRLEEAVEDPDSLWSPEAPEELIGELAARNLIVYNLYDRDTRFWVDEPPPERDLELGIGRHVAWQTPLHREAVRRAIEGAG